MSKIVILKACLSAPQIMDNLLSKLATQNPEMIEFFHNFNNVAVIKECANKAINRLADNSDNNIQRHNQVEDYFGNTSDSVSGQKIIGSLKTPALPKGMGVIVKDSGEVGFVGDNYTSGWRKEIDRLQKLFTDAFIAEITQAGMVIIGYETTITTRQVNGSPAYQIEAVGS